MPGQESYLSSSVRIGLLLAQIPHAVFSICTDAGTLTKMRTAVNQYAVKIPCPKAPGMQESLGGKRVLAPPFRLRYKGAVQFVFIAYKLPNQQKDEIKNR